MSEGKRKKMEKCLRLEEAKETLNFLIESIESKDKSYISEFLCSNNKLITLKLLNDDQLNSLSLLLVEFLDQPLRTQAIEILKIIPNNMKNKTIFFESVKGRVVDISKLLYLKGKLDYIKLTKLSTEKKEPQTVVDLKE